MMDLQIYITAFVTLFVIIDPVGLAPIFAGLTFGMSFKQRIKIALRAVSIAFLILTVFAIFGFKILNFLGISMPAFRIAGGLLLFLTALEMLFERRTERREQHTENAQESPTNDPSVFPLATPLLGGPGAITSMILLVESSQGLTHLVLIELVLASVLALAFVLFALTNFLEKLLGQTGILVITRVMGMLLAALSVQFVIDGALAVFS